MHTKLSKHIKPALTFVIMKHQIKTTCFTNQVMDTRSVGFSWYLTLAVDPLGPVGGASVNLIGDMNCV